MPWLIYPQTTVRVLSTSAGEFAKAEATQAVDSRHYMCAENRMDCCESLYKTPSTGLASVLSVIVCWSGTDSTMSRHCSIIGGIGTLFSHCENN
jgi:hypothetical protein